MGILCLLSKHEPVPSNVWNQGYYFSRCCYCDCEMIGRGGNWTPIPRGYKVVWRPRSKHLDWTPWVPEREPIRLSDMIASRDHEDCAASKTIRSDQPGSSLPCVVESINAPASRRAVPNPARLSDMFTCTENDDWFESSPPSSDYIGPSLRSVLEGIHARSAAG